MGLNTFLEVASLDYQLANFWLFELDDYPDLNLFVTSTSLTPLKLNTEDELPVYTGVTRGSEFSITFRVGIDFAIVTFFENWFNDVYDVKTKTFKVISDRSMKYKTGRLAFYQPVKDSYVTKTYRIIDAVIQGFDSISVDLENGSALEMTVSFKADDIEALPSSTSYLRGKASKVSEELKRKLSSGIN